MRLETTRTKAWLIGDPHFGREFRNGCPLNRRGERERMQRVQFIEELNTPGVDTVVMVGDLFDKPIVPLSTLSQVIEDVVCAAKARPDVTFVYMAGNHDRSRQMDVTGAWEIFTLAVSWLDNVLVSNEVVLHKDIVCFAWDWTLTAEEQVGTWHNADVHTVVGHWDMKSFGGDDSHLCPVKLLQQNFGEDVVIYSGHYHEEKDYEIAGVTVHCTGSLQPYAHGEGDMYVTLNLAEAVARDDLKYKVVRLRLAPGEDRPDIDCLQLTTERLVEEVTAEDGSMEEVATTTFNVANTLDRELAERQVPENVQTFIKEKIGAVD